MSTSNHTGANGATAGWSAAENKLVRKHYPTSERGAVLAALPGRSWNAIGLQAGALNVSRFPYWNPKRLRLLRMHYPTKGGPYVAALLGCDAAKVRKAASLRGIERVTPPKLLPTPKPPKAVTPKPAPKPKPQPKPVPAPVAQHQPARLENLINQKQQKKKNAKPLVHKSLTVEEFKKLPADHPGRVHYLRDGARGWDSWVQSQQAA